MKKELTFIILTFVLLLSSCEDDTDNNVSSSCNETCLLSVEILAGADGTTIEETTHEYNTDNKLISRVKNIVNAQIITDSYLYDANGYLTRYGKSQSNGFSERHDYTNDENGLRISEEFYWSGNYAATYFYSYDSNNNLISKEQYDEMSNTYSQFFEYIYENNLLVEENWYTSNGGDIQFEKTYEYNADGLLVLETSTNGNNLYRYEYNYNDLAELILKERFKNGDKIGCTEHEYDECSNRILSRNCLESANDTRVSTYEYNCQ